ncbi:MAG: 2-aminoethylphosphonate--pyruvate transaminase, partial [Oscillospiraceae bacterium]|nr:2-aminoethylphosphonate--pyruvate transaminase [Oscillospiraceae bacterium]
PMSQSGKWRYTSATHVVRAFYQALDELEEEGGVEARYKRYCENQRILVEGMEKLGLNALLPKEMQSPIITSFLYPNDEFDFMEFYEKVKARGFVLYPGKISNADTFRVGNIGEVYPDDMRRLLDVIKEVKTW